MEVESGVYSRRKSEIHFEQTRDSRGSKDSQRKRTYQRDQTSKKNHWRSKDNKSSAPSRDDLRSPCHKHPRFKGQQDRSLKETPQSKGPWHKSVDLSQQDKEAVLENKDFPPLGFGIDRFTPETNKDWGSIVEEEEQLALRQSIKENQKPQKFKRRLLLSASDSSGSKDANKNAEGEECKAKSKVLRPMITDPHKLTQRQKQINIGKNTVSYGRYIKTVPRPDRSKNDPWTPDKFQQCSTRSWVGQIKVWRRRLHTYDLSSKSKEDLFSIASSSSSQTTEDINMQEEQPKQAPRSIEDMFEGFDLDSCLQDDGYPL